MEESPCPSPLVPPVSGWSFTVLRASSCKTSSTLFVIPINRPHQLASKNSTATGTKNQQSWKLFARKLSRRREDSPHCLASNDNVASMSNSNATWNTEDRVLFIVVHGGPGLSDHSESFHGIRNWLHPTHGVDMLIFWDQLGCGKSTAVVEGCGDSSGNDEWQSWTTLSGHVEQLDQVIAYCRSNFGGNDTEDSINLRVGVLGHSWGGQILLEWLHRNQTQNSSVSNPNIDWAIVSNAPLDHHTYQQHNQFLRDSLEDPSILAYYEEQDAALVQDSSIGALIYKQLIGTSDLLMTGALAHWTIMDRLPSLLSNPKTPPCLFVATRDDTISYKDYETLATVVGIEEPYGRHQVEILSAGGHGPFFGPTADQYFDLLGRFLLSSNDPKTNI